ncbi:MAG: hypothetical protein ACPKQO_07375 [Nitrososphaeraceae archaeon]
MNQEIHLHTIPEIIGSYDKFASESGLIIPIYSNYTQVNMLEVDKSTYFLFIFEL